MDEITLSTGLVGWVIAGVAGLVAASSLPGGIKGLASRLATLAGSLIPKAPAPVDSVPVAVGGDAKEVSDYLAYRQLLKRCESFDCDKGIALLVELLPHVFGSAHVKEAE